MKLALAVIAGVIGAASIGLCADVRGGGSSRSKAEEAVKEREGKYADAVKRQDVLALGNILADDFAAISSRGEVRGKAQEIDDIKGSPAVFHKVVENVRALAVLRPGGECPTIIVQFLIDRQNFERMPEMYELGRSMGADRIRLSAVLEIPLERIERSLLLAPEDAAAARPYLEQAIAADRDRKLLLIDFPIQGWNEMALEIYRGQGHRPLLPVRPTAASFRDENGHCFFGWYTAVIRGNGDMYPCCLLLSPEYTPIGKAARGKFSDQWKGSGFTRLRVEMRSVLLKNPTRFEPETYTTIKKQCVEPGMCYLKNMYFRGDEEFYARLGRVRRALGHARGSA